MSILPLPDRTCRRTWRPVRTPLRCRRTASGWTGARGYPLQPYRSSSTWALKDSIRSEFSFIYLKDKRLGEFVYISHGQYWGSGKAKLIIWIIIPIEEIYFHEYLLIWWRLSSLISVRLGDKTIFSNLWFRAELQFFRPRSRASRSEKGQTGMRVTADIFKPITQIIHLVRNQFYPKFYWTSHEDTIRFSWDVNWRRRHHAFGLYCRPPCCCGRRWGRRGFRVQSRVLMWKFW